MDSVSLSLQFNNGQTVSVAANGNVSIIRPKVFPIVKINSPYGGQISVWDGSYWLDLTSNAMDFRVYISKTHPGNFGLTQLVNRYSQTGTALPPFINWHSTDGDLFLDGSGEYYDSKTVNLSDGSWPSDDQYEEYCEINDAPGLALGVLYGFYDGDWKTYVRFTPIESGSIPVTLGRIDWSWDSVANTTNGTWQVTADSGSDPSLHDDDQFPEWEDFVPSPKDDINQ